MEVIWPFIRISVLRNGDTDGLPEVANREQNEFEFELLYGDDNKEGQLNDYLDIMMSCLRDQKSYFQSFNQDAAGDLLAVMMPFKIYNRQKEEAMGPESDYLKSKPQNGLLCFWRNDSAGPLLAERDYAIIDLIVSQVNLYSRIYNILDNYNHLLRKFRHDLRTPLTSVTMISGLLAQEDGDKEAQEFGQMLRTASDKMDDLLNAFKSDLAG